MRDSDSDFEAVEDKDSFEWEGCGRDWKFIKQNNIYKGPQAAIHMAEPLRFFQIILFTEKLINGITTATNNYVCNKANWLTRSYQHIEFGEHAKSK